MKKEKELIEKVEPDWKQFDSPSPLRLVGDSCVSKQGVADSQMENK